MGRINTISDNQLIFLGTGGGRFTVFNQIRKSGGIWFKLNGKLFAIDPGPGALVEAIKHKLYPSKLSGVFLSHRHLDHSADINAIIESMTEGGHKKRGTVLAPYEATEVDPVILHYNRKNFHLINQTEFSTYEVDGVKIEVKAKHLHTTETYGAVFSFSSHKFAFIPDTLYFDDLSELYRADIVIMNTVFCHTRPGFKHLSSDDVCKFLEKHRPKKLIMTHFGLSFLKEKPWEVAKQIASETGVDVVAAYDGMVVEL
ncbi:MBL fold metallo-hydrolase [Hippea maritima]|uniref:Beta-lactamase domain protein n=1 Tax=Hippea maritima (strain ATCC 700847 / DSM 10411 / MH2) TaxID=760142 RepID=F2LX92_HIPMA|nr:MBL fold metallo-hydrolase [Hippea maritima]AEA33150.1 beta-lactamase domain protein [Hippea maritima DSM 10411]